MARHRVPLYGKPIGYATIEADATIGATVGGDLRWSDGALVDEAALRAAMVPPESGGPQITYWRLILEIPPNVVALAETATTGLYTITGAGTSVTRTIQAAAGETTVANGDGVAGNPVIGLADVTPTTGGTLQRYGFDAKGRRDEEEAATTDDLTEGATNLYFTDERAQDAAGAVLDDSGDVELHYETSPVRRIWAALSSAILSAINSALQPGDDVSELNNDAGYLTDAPSDGSTYGRKDGDWEPVASGGAEDFTDLGDVPSNYTGAAGQFVKVNAGETGLEFVAGAGVTAEWGDITGTLADQTDLQAALDDKYDASNPDGFTSNTGTVTSVGTGSGLTGGPITSTGTVSLSAGSIASLALADSALQSGDNVSELANDAGYTTNVGTVTNVATGTGLTGGPITASGTVALDSASVASLALADTATQPGDLAVVATTGDYDDLINKPSIPAAQVNSDWTAVTGVAEILNKPTLGTMAAEAASSYTPTSGLAAVALSNDYGDLDNLPSIPSSLSDLSGDSDDVAEGATHLFLTSAERSKLAGVEAGAQVNAVDTVNGQTGAVVLDFADVGAEEAFSKGDLVQGSGVSLTGTLTGRLVGTGNITIAATGGGGGQVDSVVPGTGIDVDDTDPENPVVSLDGATQASLLLADGALQAARGTGLSDYNDAVGPANSAAIWSTGGSAFANSPPGYGTNASGVLYLPAATSTGLQLAFYRAGSDSTRSVDFRVRTGASTFGSWAHLYSDNDPISAWNSVAPSGFVNTSANQSSIAGDKSWTGGHTFSANMTFTGNNRSLVFDSAQIRSATAGLVISAATTSIFLRPMGDSSTTNQVQLTSTGALSVAGNLLLDASTDGSWQAITYSNGWTAYTTGSRPTPGVRKLGNYVKMRGAIAPGSIADNDIVAVLPANYRPPSRVMFFVGQLGGASPTKLTIESNGNMRVYDGGGSGACTLDGISFYVN